MVDKGVRNNSPDASKYHQSIDGMPHGTMIPRSGLEGESLGFDHDRPTQVIVDPGEDGGGFELDLNKLVAIKDKFNSSALRNEVASDPTKFYRELANSQKNDVKSKGKPMENVQSDAISSTTPILSPLPPLDSSPEVKAGQLDGSLRRLLEEEKLKATQQQSSDYQRRVLVQELDKYQAEQLSASPALHSQLQQLMAGMAQQRETINALVALQTEKFAVAEDIAEGDRNLEEKKAPEDTCMYPHGIFFLEGDKPQKPQYETYFEMSKMGTMAARYHAVIAGQDCVALVYDTRFEDGFQYLPPNLGEERITVSVPKLNNAVYTCSSLGLHWTLGCMDVVILIKHAEGE